MQIRRRFMRWQVDREAKIKLEGAENFANCIINDISFLGASITLALKLPKDTFLKFTLVLSGEHTLDTLEAWVAWHKGVDGKNIYGLYFTKIRDSDKEKIYLFLRRNHPEQINRRCWREPEEDLLTEKKGGEAMDDRRVFQRFTIKLPLKFLDTKSGKEGQAQTQDISAKGLGVSANLQLEPNTPLEMWLDIPDRGEPLYTRGEVVWSRSAGPDECRLGINLEKADFMGLSRVLRVA